MARGLTTREQVALVKALRRVISLRGEALAEKGSLSKEEVEGIAGLLVRDSDRRAKCIVGLKLHGFISEAEDEFVINRTKSTPPVDAVAGVTEYLADAFLCHMATRGFNAALETHHTSKADHEIACFLVEHILIQDRLVARAMKPHLPAGLYANLIKRHWSTPEILSEREASIFSRALIAERYRDGRTTIVTEQGRAFIPVHEGRSTLSAIQSNALIDRYLLQGPESSPRTVPMIRPLPHDAFEVHTVTTISLWEIVLIDFVITLPPDPVPQRPVFDRRDLAAAVAELRNRLHPEPMSAILRRRLEALKSA